MHREDGVTGWEPRLCGEPDGNGFATVVSDQGGRRKRGGGGFAWVLGVGVFVVRYAEYGV